eukprot:TRINITY_DN5465_c0_g1_i1.p1 TRINITY_DN5465_c0_g1~~TRINITY_DN5465_c0_g1_i1.p1  ORF type:complete len:397 (+),score=62.10 TRINITY_DN5465_c0_g1_i1:45-1235(+)
MSKGFSSSSVHSPSVNKLVSALNVPIYLSSTYKLEDAQHGADLCDNKEPLNKSKFLYQRWGNPTNDAVERHISQLEGGYGSYLMSSGMSAISTVLLGLLKSGDSIVLPYSLYGGTTDFVKDILTDFGVEACWIDSFDISEYEKHIKPNTKLIYGETPSNPVTKILDLEAFANLGKSKNVITVVDSTFASPFCQKPHSFGVDLIVHSATKYLGGHSDVVSGVISCKSKELYDRLRSKVRLLGGVLAPMEAYLLERGIKTLGIRMPIHNSNTLAVATYLESRVDKVEKVYYPGLVSHPDHELAKKQMNGYGGVVSFELKGGLKAGIQLIENVKLITLAVSLGGVESLIEHAASMTHAHASDEEKKRGHITDGLIRLSIGIEDVDDIIRDLEQALEKVN